MNIKVYRKKPIEVTALQFDGKNKSMVRGFIQACIDTHGTVIGTVDGSDEDELYIETLEGIFHVSPGDFVICGINNELYPCKPDIFAKTYEEVV